jgi:proline dehydrogenase
MSLLDRLVAATLPITPRFVVGKVARRYIAGEEIADAAAAIRELNAEGVLATVDVLGEFITDLSEARATAAEYGRILDLIRDQGLRSGVSVKLTAFGLLLDEDACLELVRGLVRRAADMGGFVRVDMEDSPCTDRTLDLVETLHAEGHPVGTVLQSYMRRTPDDARRLVEKGISVRLCKGIYREPPEIAFQEREEIRENFRRTLRILLEGEAPVGIATHDEVLVDDAVSLLAERDLPKERYEFQMLLGVRKWLRDELIQAGHPMRVYVPYGKAWYGYSVRRLRENPAIAGHVFRALLGRDGRRRSA